ncbi:MAG: hypothetical protein HY547_06590 [Elusimicrobia bacterium]|nr:hypothetical protein [Elusimicrobiota bacterium]
MTRAQQTGPFFFREDDSPAFYQIFVCKGWVKTGSGRYGVGDFFCDWHAPSEIAGFDVEEGSVLLVKRQSFVVQHDYEPLARSNGGYRYFNLPFLAPSHDPSGLPFDVNSEFLLGNALRKVSRDMTAVTMLEFFHQNTVAPSHYHEYPVWHEFIYLQGGQLTPDGFYAAGDHIASIPDCKEGPYLACFEEERNFPAPWPQYVPMEELMRPVQSPWPKIFSGRQDGIYGVLFVHFGPFAIIRPWALANWTILDPHELGPEG